jgi:methylated-DNA-[protein]-cysteine S-methyltransferase
MNKHEQELAAVVLGEVEPSPEMRRWLNTQAGRRELAAYRQTVSALNRLYAGRAAVPTSRVVTYTNLETPLGRIFLAATDAGLARLSFGQSEAAFVTEVREALKAEPVRAPEKLKRMAGQVKAYLGGKRRAFDMPVDLQSVTTFQQRVLRAALKIPRGQTLTYSEVARRIGQPRAARAVGQALSRNPIPIVVPCHRVLAADGSLRGYSGGQGVKTKAWLLALEGALTA